LVAAAKFLGEATKNLFVVPNFVAETKPIFFSVNVNNEQTFPVQESAYSHQYVSYIFPQAQFSLYLKKLIFLPKWQLFQVLFCCKQDGKRKWRLFNILYLAFISKNKAQVDF